MSALAGRRRAAVAVADAGRHAYHPARAAAGAFRDRLPDTGIRVLGTADSIAARILARDGERLVPCRRRW